MIVAVAMDELNNAFTAGGLRVSPHHRAADGGAAAAFRSRLRPAAGRGLIAGLVLKAAAAVMKAAAAAAAMAAM